MLSRPHPTPTDPMVQSLERWRERLIDLSRRNPLIAMRLTRRTHLRLSRPELTRLCDRLLRERADHRFWWPADADAPNTSDSADAPKKRIRPRPDELLCEDLDRRELMHILTHLYRRARSDFQERGLRILHVAIGVLEWREISNGPLISSPIVLVPVILERPRPGEPFILRVAEDEGFLNPALQLRLQRDFHLRLPALPDPIDESFRIHDYLDTIGLIAAALPEARIDKSAMLTLLSFDKGVVHQDLTVNAERVLSHPLIRTLVGEPNQKATITDQSPNQHLILDADSSQETAVRAARAGQNFVLIGPPGTGKSQTITNIIADQLARGRTVLFVSEKIAALEVVYRRLRQAGLGDVCLEVHSHLAQRARVVQELHRCLHLDDVPPVIDDDRPALDDIRSSLDQMIAALHQPRAPLQRSAVEAAEVIAQYPQLPLVRLELANLLERDRAWLEEAQRAVHRLARLGHLLQEGERFPWSRLKPQAFSLALRDELTRRIERIRLAREQRAIAQKRIASGMGRDDAPLEWLLKLVELLERSPKPPREWFHDPHLEQRLEQVDQRIQLREAVRQQRQTLVRKHGPGAWQIESGAAARLVERWHALHPLLGPNADRGFLSAASALRHWINATQLSLSTWETTARAVGVSPSALSIRRLERLAEWFTLVQTPPISAGRQALLERYDASLFSLDLDRLIARFAGPYRSRWGRMGQPYRRDRDLLASLHRSGRLPTDILGDLQSARDVLRQEREQRQAYDSRLQQLARSIGFDRADPMLAPETETRLTRLPESLVQWHRDTERVRSILPTDPPDERPFAELRSWLQQLDEALRSWEALIRELGRYISPQQGTITELIDDVRQVELWRSWLNAEDQDVHARRSQFGPMWRGLESTDWEAIRRALEWVQAIRQPFAPQPVPEAMIELALTTAPPSSEELLRAERHYQETCQELADLFESDPGDDPEALLHRLDELPDWFDWRDLPGWLEGLGLSRLWQFITETDLPPSAWPGLFEKAFFSAWLDAHCALDAHLRAFRGEEHDERIRRFRHLDQSQLRHNAQHVAHLTRHQSPEPLPANEIETLHRQALIRVRHRPLRQLFAEIPTLLQRLKPCLLMSPMSVSQFLTGPTSATPLSFDLVIFDEASQIPPEDALGAIYRGRQIIIVGDDQQLPPTSFFQTENRFSPSSDTVSVDEPYPSILDQARIVVPSYLLRWHYRSRDESLIAFSNHHFYDNRLITFPNAHRDQRRGVQFHHVPDGIYDRGGRRQNRREAEVVADLVIEQLRNQPERTVGVIAFSQAQMIAIEDQLERRRRQFPEFEEFFRDDRLDGVFVRNLETVQGDERDVIFLSIGYGKDPRGKPSLNFGPLNRAGGERRLNVAVTRARERLVVVSSLTARDMAGRSNTLGIKLLRQYLEYAAAGPGRFSDQRDTTASSIIWEDVRTVLAEWGYRSELGVGCSSSRVDVGVIDPDQPGRYLLGILGDGLSYRAARSASERDRLRPGVLESLGWRLHTIWTLDWIRKRGPELERLRQTLERLRQESRATLRSRRRTNTLPTG